jgi:hypothetical protein
MHVEDCGAGQCPDGLVEPGEQALPAVGAVPRDVADGDREIRRHR